MHKGDGQDRHPADRDERERQRHPERGDANRRLHGTEAAGYQDNWKSDITLWINGKDCGTFTSPGDFGSRRGKNNPPSWGAGRTQYGLLTTWTVTDEGSFVNDSRGASTAIDDLDLLSRSRITVRIGNREDARNVGGFNLFGRAFGDDDQDTVLQVTYLPA